MSVSLLTPDLRRILDDLGRRIGILERRTKQTVSPSAPVRPPVRRWTQVGAFVGNLEAVYQTLELAPFGVGGLTASVGLTTGVAAGPVTLAANDVIYPGLFAPDYVSGSLTGSVRLSVFNPAVTERMRGQWTFSLTTGQNWAPTSGGSTDRVIGSDLSLVSGKLKTAAGGIYLAIMAVSFDTVPDPV